jgi:hypothetical protein
MIGAIITILKKLAVITAFVGVLYIFGRAVNSIINWDYLTSLFTVIRRFWGAANWWWDIPTMLILITASLGLDLGEWIFRAGLLPLDWIKKND